MGLKGNRGGAFSLSNGALLLQQQPSQTGYCSSTNPNKLGHQTWGASLVGLREGSLQLGMAPTGLKGKREGAFSLPILVVATRSQVSSGRISRALLGTRPPNLEGFSIRAGERQDCGWMGSNGSPGQEGRRALTTKAALLSQQQQE